MAQGILPLLIPAALFLIVWKGVDPLMVFFSLFCIVGALQHLGLVSEASEEGQQAEGERGEAPRGSSRSQSRRNGNYAEEVFEAKDEKLDHLLSEAERCLENNNYDRAAQLAKKATDKDEKSAKAWELLATAQQWTGNREQALRTVNSAMDTHKVTSPSLKNLKRELSQSKSPAEIASECEAKGKEFLTKRMYDLAMPNYMQAIEALQEAEVAEVDRPLFLRLIRTRAECAQQLQDWSLCRKDATILLEEDPNDAPALLQRAAANEALEKYKAALEDARKLLSMDSKNTAANRMVHNCQKALKDM